MSNPIETLWGNEKSLANQLVYPGCGEEIVGASIAVAADDLVGAYGGTRVDEWQTRPYNRLADNLTGNLNSVFAHVKRSKFRLSPVDVEDLMYQYSRDEQSDNLRIRGGNYLERSICFTAISSFSYAQAVLRGERGLTLGDFRCVEVNPIDQVPAPTEMQARGPVDILVTNR